jgi:hypothetical protein
MKRNLSPLFAFLIRAFSIKFYWPIVTGELFVRDNRKHKQNLYHTPFTASNQTFQTDRGQP